MSTYRLHGRSQEFTPVQIRALSAETLYLIKVAADRPKDRDDVILVGAKCTYDAVLDRAKRMFAWYADRGAFPEFVERLARRMARDFRIRLDAVDRDFTLSPVVAGKVAEIRNALEAQFLNVPNRLQSKGSAVTARRAPRMPGTIGSPSREGSRST